MRWFSLRHPACKRYHNIGFFPKLDPTPEQFDPRDFNLFQGFRIPREKAVAGDCTPLLDHIHAVLCAGNRHKGLQISCGSKACALLVSVRHVLLHPPTRKLLASYRKLSNANRSGLRDIMLLTMCGSSHNVIT